MSAASDGTEPVFVFCYKSLYTICNDTRSEHVKRHFHHHSKSNSRPRGQKLHFWTNYIGANLAKVPSMAAECMIAETETFCKSSGIRRQNLEITTLSREIGGEGVVQECNIVARFAKFEAPQGKAGDMLSPVRKHGAVNLQQYWLSFKPWINASACLIDVLPIIGSTREINSGEHSGVLFAVSNKVTHHGHVYGRPTSKVPIELSR